MNTEKEYIQAFNNGYLLEQYQPELLNRVTKNLSPSNLYLEGLFAGKHQMEQEFKEYQWSELQVIRNLAEGRSNSFGPERD